MTTVTVVTQIAAPVARVFGVFSNIEHCAERVSNIREIEMLTPGAFELGTRWLETREILSQLDSAEMEVTAFERNRTYTITHHKGGTRIDTVFTSSRSRTARRFGSSSRSTATGCLQGCWHRLGGLSPVRCGT